MGQRRIFNLTPIRSTDIYRDSKHVLLSCQLHKRGNMVKPAEVHENVRKHEETYVPKPTGTTMAVFLLLCGAIVGLHLLLR
jgi:hypothetical protein